MSFPRGTITRAGAGRRVIDFANTAARGKSRSVRKQHGREEKRNRKETDDPPSTKRCTCQASIRQKKKIDAARILTTWTKSVGGQRGESLVGRQASIKVVGGT